MTHYKNPWHTPLDSTYGPKFYTTDALPKEYRGFLIYQRLPRVFDVVKDNICVAQLAGARGARERIDLILDEPTNWWAQRSLQYLEATK